MQNAKVILKNGRQEYYQLHLKRDDRERWCNMGIAKLASLLIQVERPEARKNGKKTSGQSPIWIGLNYLTFYVTCAFPLPFTTDIRRLEFP
jgi:hypothetical protein